MSGERVFHRASRVDVEADELGAWHFREGAIIRLIPPWERIRVVREATPLVDGARAEIDIHKGPMSVRLIAEHEGVLPPREFTDFQVRGPFGSWRHVHRFLPDPEGRAMIEDSIRFRPPLGAIGNLLAGRLMDREVARQFEFRHARTREDLRRHAELAARFGHGRLKIGVTGANGLVGRQLCAFLSTGGHEVVRFVRGVAAGPHERSWNPADPRSGVAPDAVDGLDAVVHLAGEPIAEGRWTEARKRAILESRVHGTAAMANAIARAARKPRAFVCASAIGYYGDRGSDWVDERSALGTGFLAEVVHAWESAAQPAADSGVRTVHARIGFVVSAAGGGLARMLLPFKMGLGGPIGNGRQGMSWIALDDLIALLAFAVMNDDLRGPVNAVAPGALPQRGFARVLGRVLHRPAVAPLPAPIVRLMFGELGQRLLLEGAFVRPSVLAGAGFRFAYGDLEHALRLELGRLHEGEVRA
ncbi:MAG: hypothetical protein RL136_108 [Planctomycetota bacterium]|jgi:uncharacterized protein (TIGR01777 family)